MAERIARRTARLTTLAVKAHAARGRYHDGGGLYLQVGTNGTKSWVLRYMHNGRARHMGLGPLELVPLKDAREAALAARRQLKQGVDPIEAREAQRRQAQAAAASALTFKQCAERFIAAHKDGWRNDKHGDQVESSLAAYVYPHFGDLPVAAVDTGLVLKALEPIWKTRTETATRVRGRVERILDFAAARGYRSGANPARWRGHLDKLLPARNKVRPVQHHPALPYNELPAFFAALRSQPGVAARALEFTIMTAARTGETLGAEWSEFDFDKAIWTVPPERMKSSRQHRVPLSDLALAILRALPREDKNKFVFIGTREHHGLSNMAMLKVLERMKRDELTVHGFRSTFRDWSAESTSYANEVLEMALAHIVESKVESAYRRGDLYDKRRRLMRDWANFCESKPQKRTAAAPIRTTA